MAGSCTSLDDPDEPIPGDFGPGEEMLAIVTIKSNAAGGVFFQVSESLCVVPVNYKAVHKKIPCRAMCKMLVYSKVTATGMHYCQVEWVETIESGTSDGKDGSSGSGGIDGMGSGQTSPTESDGLDVLDDWMTGLEDGFLTIHYSTWWGDGTIQHSLSLFRGENAGEIYLIHDARGDEKREKADALVCFDINNLSAFAEENNRTLTLKWKTCEGESAEKIFTFKGRN